MFNSLVLDKIVTMSLIIVWMIFSCSFDVERHIFSFQLSVDTSFINTLSLRYNFFFYLLIETIVHKVHVFFPY